MRNSITLVLDGSCSEDSVCSVSIEDNEVWRRMKGRRTCLKALIRKMDGGFFDFKPKGKFFLLLMELVLAILSQELCRKQIIAKL
jgi:hypothetical protein